jgi:hypothetical protein
MKKRIAGILVILSLGVFSWAQGAKDPFDAKKSQEELEIMKGILSTTLSFVTQNPQRQASSVWRPSNIRAFYLSGQGAVFIIQTSSLRSTFSPFSSDFGYELSQQISEAAKELSLQATEMGLRAAASGIGQGVGGGIGGGKGGGTASPLSPSTSAPPSPPPIDREELRKKVEEYQAKAKKNREEAENRREKLLQSLAEAKVYLIEALANYGDSLATVKPDEYINLVLTTDGFDGGSGFGGQRTRHDIISAQKSWITDYKAGRLSLDNFKQKVLQYTE